MKGRFGLVLVLATAAVLGCEHTDSDGSGGGGTNFDGGSRDEGEETEDCDPNVDPNCFPIDVDLGPDGPAEIGNDPGQFQTYHYVLITDADSAPTGAQPGADLDAVELIQGGQSLYLTQIHEAQFGSEPPSGDNSNFNNALGPPEGQCIDQDPADWDPNTFVSMGGEGGFVVGSFSDLAEIQTGDEITVHVCTGALSEAWELAVGVSTTINDPNWFMVIEDGVGVTTATVPNLPQIPIN